MSDGLASIALSGEERALFELLLGADAWSGGGQTIRVAGGWVRDKLLGGGTTDIDFALDRMTGRAFVGVLHEYIEAHRGAGVGVRGERVPRRGLGRRYFVEQNLAKSKHLETAGVKLFGVTAEFVHLRSERYAEGSRVPDVVFGTVESDATRRDLTINALYYRLDTGGVEDFVGGLDDLRALRLRTPSEPVRTFIDDPLRVLRTLRFRSAFGGSTIDSATRSAMGDARVREAYRRKLAPERSAAELEKLFGGERPAAALRVLRDAGLAGAVFGGLDLASGGDRPERLVESLERSEALRAAGGRDRALTLLGGWLWAGLGGGAVDGVERAIVGALKPIGVGKRERSFVVAVLRGAEACLVGSFDGLAKGRVWQATHPAGMDRDDLWRLSMSLAEAWAGVMEPGSEGSIDFGARRASMESYASAGVSAEPMLDGAVLMEMLPELDPRSGFIREAQRRLVDRQLAGEIADEAGARAFVERIGDSLRARYGAGGRG